MFLKFIIFISFLLAQPSYASIRICTQNLGNFGYVKTVAERTEKSEAQLDKQRLALAKRFWQAKCDLIATQEVISKNPSEAVKVLELLASSLAELTKKKYLVLSGRSNDPLSKQGYIFRADLFHLDFALSYSYYLLKPITRWEKNRYFSRGPLRIDLTEIRTGRKLTLFNFHFKSIAAFNSFDSAKFGFEYDRVQMAQGLYDIAREVENQNPTRVFILLGDRNSDNYSASSKVLAGELDLSHFQQKLCSLSKDHTASCNLKFSDQAEYISLLQQAEIGPKQLAKPFKKFKRIDDILISQQSLDQMSKSERKKISVKMLAIDKDASDHPLYYIKLD